MKIFYNNKTYDLENDKEATVFNNNFYKATEEKSADKEADRLKLLIAAAASGKHSDFEQIKSFGEAKVAAIIYKTIKKVNRSFKKTYKLAFKNYFSTGDFKTLVVYRQFKDCFTFYKEELSILSDRRREFRRHWFKYFISALFGESKSN